MTNDKKQVMIVGGGAAGIVAAIAARRQGAQVTILERNPRIGKKILATGNGRCNYTNLNADTSCYYGNNPQFAAKVLEKFGVKDTINFFEKLGITPKVEELGKVFPMSEQASSFLDVFLYELDQIGVKVICNAYVKQLIKQGAHFKLVLNDGTTFRADKVIIATGGKAMPSSGSDGNGFELAEKLGHKVTPIFPGLVQLKLEGDFFKQIQGVKFVGTVELIHNHQSVAKERGDILFGDYGVSGPPIFQISRIAGAFILANQPVILKLTIMDMMSSIELQQLLMKRFKNSMNKTIEFSLVGLINKRLIPIILKTSGITNLKRLVKDLSSEEQEKIIRILTDWRFKIRGTKSWPSAQVTAGGIDTNEINPDTLESKIVPNLFFAGEIMDIDGQCGGYNLQWAWSSGYVAGYNAATQ